MDFYVPPITFNEELFKEGKKYRIGYYVEDEWFTPVPAIQRAVLEAKVGVPFLVTLTSFFDNFTESYRLLPKSYNFTNFRQSSKKQVIPWYHSSPETSRTCSNCISELYRSMGDIIFGPDC